MYRPLYRCSPSAPAYWPHQMGGAASASHIRGTQGTRHRFCCCTACADRLLQCGRAHFCNVCLLPYKGNMRESKQCGSTRRPGYPGSSWSMSQAQQLGLSGPGGAYRGGWGTGLVETSSCAPIPLEDPGSLDPLLCVEHTLRMCMSVSMGVSTTVWSIGCVGGASLSLTSFLTGTD